MIALHCFGESGNAYKAALSLDLASRDWRPVFVDFFGGQTRDPAWRAAVNPMGEVPVMVADGVTMTQSGVMQDWIVQTTGLLGGDQSEATRREILRWILWDNHKLSSPVGAARFMMNFLPAEKRSAEVIRYLQGRLTAAYGILDAHLADRDWIVGRSVTIADTACCGYLFYDEPFGFARADWPHIDRWLTAIAASPGWRHPYDAMPRSAA